jgi:Flp pilus assembly protein TadD
MARFLAAALLGAAVMLAEGPTSGFPTEDDAEAAALDPDIVAGKAAIERKDWETAIAVLASAALRDTRNADIESYLGFAYRKAGRLDEAFRHYARALALSPRHRGAHEYVGEAFLIVGDLARAEEHLAALRKICLIPCEEVDELAEKIEKYKAANR